MVPGLLRWTQGWHRLPRYFVVTLCSFLTDFSDSTSKTSTTGYKSGEYENVSQTSAEMSL